MEPKLQQIIERINNRDAEIGLKGSPLSVLADRSEDAENQEEMILNLSVSSNKPCEDWYGWLSLEHSAQAIVMDRFNDGASFRDEHYGDQVGIIQNPVIDTANGKLRCDVKFSPNNERAILLYKDYKDGYRKNVSIRFLVHEIVLDKKVGDVEYYRATKWEPIHAAAVPDPADPTVGANRSLNNNIQIKSKGEKMEKEKLSPEELQAIAAQVKAGLDTENQARVDRALAEGGEKELDRVGGILSTAREYKDQVKGLDLMKEAEKYINLKASVRDFQDVIVKQFSAQTSYKGQEIGMKPEDVSKYSFRNLILSQVPNSGVDASRELKASKEYQEKSGIKARGILVPPDVFLRDRNLVTSSATAGGNLVADNLYPSNFIELARKKTLSDKLGVTSLTGLVGDALIPRQTGAGTFAWMTNEYTANSQSDLTVDQVSLTPKLGSSWTAYSRKLLQQSTPSIDMMVENDLARITAIGKDLAVFHGTGTTQPQGIVGASGVPSNGYAAITHANTVEMKTLVATADCDAQSMYYVTNPSVAGVLETREKVSGYPEFLLRDGKVAGYPLMVSNQIATGTMIFGDFSQVILAEWGGLDIVVDPFTLSTAGLIRVTVFIYVDVGIRQAGAFAVGTSIS